MTTLKINEGDTVQFPMVKHAVEIGWSPLNPAEAEAKRQGRANMIFRDDLEAKLLVFNAWLSEDQARAIVDTIDALPTTIEGNREVLAWIRGERQWYDEAEKRHRPIQVIDFDAPSNNDFVVTWEWKIEPLARKGNRADVMFVVNGAAGGDRRAQEPEGRRTRSTGL
ncbi:MAG: type I restriction endonuclease [Nocardioides sp.]